MITGRRATDWLRDAAQPETGEGDRRSADRRGGDRRAPRRPIDPLFAALLIKHVAAPQTEIVTGYRADPAPFRKGLKVNRWA